MTLTYKIARKVTPKDAITKDTNELCNIPAAPAVTTELAEAEADTKLVDDCLG